MLGELNAAEIERMLYANVVGRIGMHAFGRTYVVPITYVYDGTSAFARCREGMKVHMMRENPHVCFEVDAMDANGNWRSVIAQGVYHELAEHEAADRFRWIVSELAMRLSGPPGETVHPREDAQPGVVFRLHLEEKTGRFERRA